MSNASHTPAAKLKMMKASIRCLVLGLLSLLPLIGVPFALAALWISFSVRRREKQFWNPAKPQRVMGLACASLGALVWSTVDTILIYNALYNYSGG